METCVDRVLVPSACQDHDAHSHRSAHDISPGRFFAANEIKTMSAFLLWPTAESRRPAHVLSRSANLCRGGVQVSVWRLDHTYNADCITQTH